MGMRINQNVLSQSTYANLSIANNRLESSIGKLSSGLRINSAADDAAGLAISEKMRRQIKGLGRAKLNAQDGISMIQTAEGALNETQSAIQRMRELALQSANDTLTSNDRLEIQKEVEELKTQIDSIASSTEFNTKKLLNGNQTALLSTSTESVKGLVTGLTGSNGDYDLSFYTVRGGVSQMQTSQMLRDKNTGELAKGITQLQDITSFYSESGEDVLSSPQTLTLNGNGKSATITLDRQMTLNDVAASLQNAISSASGLGIKNSSVQVVNTTTDDPNNGGYLKFTSGFTGENGDITIAGAQDVIDALGFSVARESVNNMVRVSMSDVYGNSRNVETSTDRASALLDGIDVKFKSQAAQITGQGGIVDGMQFGSAAETLGFTVKATGSTAVITINITFAASSTYSMQGIADAINKEIIADSTLGTGSSAVTYNVEVKASVVDGEIRLTYNPANEDDTSFAVTSGSDILGIRAGTYNGFVNGEKDREQTVQGVVIADTKITANQNIVFSLKANGATAATTFDLDVVQDSAVATTGDMKEINALVSEMNAKFVSVGARVDAVNGSLVLTSTQVGEDENGKKSSLVLAISASVTTANFNSSVLNNIGLKAQTTYGSGDSTAKMHVVNTQAQFQIGADAGDNMKIGIADMGTEALGLDKIDLTSVSAAEKSLERLNQALDKVSAERSKLGAYQNRLDYTISNLTSTTTNLTSAESRIRDVDVASEMMEFTRNQIVTQAATSMLAQANALPQNALSLLG